MILRFGTLVSSKLLRLHFRSHFGYQRFKYEDPNGSYNPNYSKQIKRKTSEEVYKFFNVKITFESKEAEIRLKNQWAFG